MQTFKNWKALLLLSGSLLATCSLHAQAVYGSLYGTVTDSTGAVVPNATVTVTDVSKGTAVTATANASGDYTVDHLIPDVYNVKVTASGFEGFEANGIQVFADQSPKVDASLKTGSSTETVQVNADSIPVLKTDRADVATTFSGQTIQDLPIGDRNFTNLQLPSPGRAAVGLEPRGGMKIRRAASKFRSTAKPSAVLLSELDGTDNQDPILGNHRDQSEHRFALRIEDHHAELRRRIRQGRFVCRHRANKIWHQQLPRFGIRLSRKHGEPGPRPLHARPGEQLSRRSQEPVRRFGGRPDLERQVFFLR